MLTTYPGAMNKLTAGDISENDLKKAKHLHFSSYFLQPGMWDHLGDLFRTAKKLGLTTSFDMQWDPQETWELDFKDVLPGVDVFLPNEKELPESHFLTVFFMTEVVDQMNNQMSCPALFGKLVMFLIEHMPI